MDDSGAEAFTGREVTGQVLGGMRRLIRFGLDRRIAERIYEAIDATADIDAFGAPG